MKNDKKHFHVVYITDSGYLFPTTVSIKSAVKHAGNERVTIHVITIDVAEEEMSRLAELGCDTVDIDIIGLSNEMEDLGLLHPYVSKAALYKFRLGEIFSDLDRILYLDGDIILLPGYLSVFDHDVSDYYMGAVADMQAELMWDRIRYNGNDHYYNSGVLLLNLKRMRQNDCCAKLIEFKKTDRERFMDQDAINKIMGKETLGLPLEFNYMITNTAYYSKEEIADFYQRSIDEIDAIIEKPFVCHLTGGQKPWNNLLSYKKDIWWDNLNDEEMFQTVVNYCRSDSLREESLALGKTQDLVKKLSDRLESSNREIASLHLQIANLQEQITNLTHTVNYYKNRTVFGAVKRAMEKAKGE